MHMRLGVFLITGLLFFQSCKEGKVTVDDLDNKDLIYSTSKNNTEHKDDIIKDIWNNHKNRLSSIGSYEEFRDAMQTSEDRKIVYEKHLSDIGDFEDLEVLFTPTIIRTKLTTKHDCDDIPQMFTNFEEALEFVRGLDWTYSDDATFEGSWINSAEYYSCDRKTGFFIMCTDGKCYIHDYVEMEVWEGIKGTLKPGSYYHKYMRDKYQMYDRVEQR